MKRIVCLVVCGLSLAVANQDASPFQFAACKPQLLAQETGIVVRNKDWRGGQFANIMTRSAPKPSCVHSSRWTELDTVARPPFIVFHQTLHYRRASGKGFAKFTELYQVDPGHYVFKYSHGKGESAKVHVKWLKLVPGVLEIQYMCSDDFIFAANTKDVVLVTTTSAEFSTTVGALTRDILQRNHFKLKNLMMVPNCDCASHEMEKAKSQCDNKPLLYYLNK